MESSSVLPDAAAPSEPVVPVLTTLTVLNPGQSADVCGPDGVCA
ncbi:hypothetical protein [Kineosporia babensis]|nr:hypothetical protein [Kineosporia babensis]